METIVPSKSPHFQLAYTDIQPARPTHRPREQLFFRFRRPEPFFSHNPETPL
jgi:hypothetical protein